MRLSSFQLTRRLALALVWLIKPVVACLHLLVRLVPERMMLQLAVRPIGWLTRIGKRHEILSRIRLVLGKETVAGEREKQFWRAHLDHIGRNVIEPIYFYCLADAPLVQRVELVGAEHLARALEQQRGAVLFLNHLGNPGAIVAGFGLRGYDLTISGNAMVATIFNEEVPLTYLESVVQRMFRRGHVKRALLGDRLPQRMAETLGRNGLFAMFIDFPVGRKHNQFVDCGDARMSVNLGPAILALRHRAPVLCVTCLRVGDNQHRLTVHPQLITQAEDENAPAALLQAAVSRMLPDLRAHPEQWWPWDWAKFTPRE